MFNYRSIQKKVSRFDSSYDLNQPLVFAVVANGIRKASQKEFFWKTLFFIVFVLITGLALKVDPTLISALIGGMIGGSLIANHPHILCVLNENLITIYFYNRFSTKIIDKKILNIDNIVITEITTQKSSHHLSLFLENTPYTILISDKTLGFKEQEKNVKELLLLCQRMNTKKES
jgi:hypothetical protein